MRDVRVEIQDLEPGDIIVPSGREVLSITIEPETPVGSRVVHLRNSNNDGTSRHVFRADVVVTVRRS